MKIGFLSLGCPKNLVDGEVMLGIARDAGHEITSDASNADVIVVNTCAFIDSAKQESVDAILEMAGKKRDGSCSRLVVTGCLAERYRDELKKEIPGDRRRAWNRRGAEDTGCCRCSGLGTRDSRVVTRRGRTGHVFQETTNSESRAPSPETPKPRRPRLPLRRRHAASADDPVALRIREGRRRLRLHVCVLHHPHTARLVSQPDRTTPSCARRGRWRNAAFESCS